MSNADKAALKPPGYKAIQYQPAQKIESEDKMDKVPQDKLQRGYTLWVMIREQNMYQKKPGAGAYDQSDLQDVASFDTVQTFWMMYQHLRRPTAMPYGTTLHIFQTGIKPVWEDPALAKGSRFQLKSEKSHTSKYWEDLLLALIGEQIGTKSQMIAGLVLNLKPQFDKIGIWFTDCEDQDEIAKIKEDIVAILQIEEKELEYDVF